jgi:hypothetical protein
MHTYRLLQQLGVCSYHSISSLCISVPRSLSGRVRTTSTGWVSCHSKTLCVLCVRSRLPLCMFVPERARPLHISVPHPQFVRWYHYLRKYQLQISLCVPCTMNTSMTTTMRASLPHLLCVSMNHTHRVYTFTCAFLLHRAYIYSTYTVRTFIPTYALRTSVFAYKLLVSITVTQCVFYSTYTVYIHTVHISIPLTQCVFYSTYTVPTTIPLTQCAFYSTYTVPTTIPLTQCNLHSAYYYSTHTVHRSIPLT